MIWNIQQILLLTGYGCFQEIVLMQWHKRDSVLELSSILANSGTISWSIHELLSWNSLHSLRSNDKVGSSVYTLSETQCITHSSLCCTATLVQTITRTQSSSWSPEFMLPFSKLEKLVWVLLLWWQGNLNVISWKPRGTFWKKATWRLCFSGSSQAWFSPKAARVIFLVWLLPWGPIQGIPWDVVGILVFFTCSTY